MTQPVKDPIHTVMRAGFANPLTLDIKVTDPSYVEVFVDDLLLDPDEYTITGINSDAGVEITITDAEDVDWFPDASRITAAFAPPVQQSADLSAGGIFGKAYEDAIDAIVRILLSQNGAVDRTLKVPFGVTGNIVLPFPVAGASIAWNADGTGFINGPSTADISIITPYLEDIADVAAVAGSVVQVASFQSHVVTVASNIAAVVATGNSIGNVNTVAVNIANVDIVADDMTAVLLAATNMAAIQAASTNAANAAASAAAALISENNVALAGEAAGTIKMRFGALLPGFIAWGEGGTFNRATYPGLAAWLDVNGAELGLDAGQIAAGTIPDWTGRVARTAGGLGPAVGAFQEDAFQGHRHGIPEPNQGNPPTGGSTTTYSVSPTNDTVTGLPVTDGINGTPRTASETRVKSFGVRWQIKAAGAVADIGTINIMALGAQVTDNTNRIAVLEAIGKPFTKEYVSAPQTITVAGLLSLSHGLGTTPKKIEFDLVCTVAEYGFNVGDITQVGTMLWTSATSFSLGFSSVKTSTNINIRFANEATRTLVVLNFTTGAVTVLTNSNWRLIVRAWA